MIDIDLNEIKKRMFNEQLYFSNDDTLMEEQMKCLDKVFEYNQLKPSQRKEKEVLLMDMFAKFGEGSYIETPFYANWGGKNTYFGHHVYANFNLTLIDDCDIYVGNHVMIGPNVVLSAGSHPVEPKLRRKQAQYNAKISIADNVWIGANTVVMPGVQIKENSIIGAGSIVTQDIPADVIAFGSPCKVIREITDHDRTYYYKNFLIDI